MGLVADLDRALGAEVDLPSGHRNLPSGHRFLVSMQVRQNTDLTAADTSPGGFETGQKSLGTRYRMVGLESQGRPRT